MLIQVLWGTGWGMKHDPRRPSETGKGDARGDPLQDRGETRAGLTFAGAKEKDLAAKLDEVRNDKRRKQREPALALADVPICPGVTPRPLSFTR
ncbi:hypothetical protein H9N28_07430 [Rhodobacter capsulatus]|uniref:hypothetical protein n=1 Tax=Rhodobacter capsulatus TaxID=1061 RepID=UPI0011BD009F|nr:hypothetical protein [Rhodobacter capsulatus]QNR64635.1 hypothetical protein H9N28_07430 [Rhodobacter capsulatus]